MSEIVATCAPWRASAAARRKAQVLLEHGAGMSLEQFAMWDETQRVLSRRFKLIKPRLRIGMSERRRLALLQAALPADVAAGIIGEEERPPPPTAITTIESLACAHVAIGLPMPIARGDVGEFATWCAERFGHVDDVARCLGVRTDWITDRIRGFDIRGKKREARAPDAGLIRAMDWLAYAGPFNPWGGPP